MTEFKANDYVGSYKILNKFSEGGMAMIYKALQPSLKRTVVIKKLKDPNREIIRRFKKEALLSASFHQENLVAIYDFLYINRSYYLVMEYVDGEDLRTVIDHMAPIPSNLAALIILGIARGLEYTHARNIIHRDIKPSNILLAHGGEVKLIDFGVAKDDISTRLTLTGMIVGTPAYMAPEQANGDPLSPQSDIFSLGILLYEMITGVKPFQGENNTEVLAKIVRNRYIGPEKINPDIPYRLRRIVKKALRKEPARRYKNATEMIHDLEQFIPWQLRSRRKEAISRFIGKLNKAESTSINDSIDLAVYSGVQSWGWRAFRIGLSAITILILGFFVFEFSKHQLGYVKVHLPEIGSKVKINQRSAQAIPARSSVLGPLLKGRHTFTISDVSGEHYFVANTPIIAADTVYIHAEFSDLQNPAQISVFTEPADAEVYIDSYPVGYSSLHNLQLDKGKHLIEIRKNGYQPINDQQTFKPAKFYSLHYQLEPASKPR